MRVLVLALLTGCGRLGFEAFDDAIGDGPVGDSIGPGDGTTTDAPPTDGPTVRACHSDARYVTAAGLVNTYREAAPQVSWQQARLDCMVDDADLWVVDDAIEQQAFDGDWTGITDMAVENEWRKLDGTLATFLPFQVGEPDGGNADDCLRNDSGGFEDRDCDDQRDYVCECPAP